MLGLTEASRREIAPGLPMPARPSGRLRLKDVRAFVDATFGEDLHAKRVLSLANSAAGVLHAASLAVHAIGRAYAQLTGGQAKHGTKQADRLLNNGAVRPWDLLDSWVRFVLGVRTEVVIALDWTDFEKDDHTALCAYLVTRHGRATPLAWKTVPKSTLQGKRTGYEHELVERLHAAIPSEVRVVLLADRGFGDQKLYALLGALGWEYVIRFRDCILVEDETGQSRPGAGWVAPRGRAVMLPNARVTADRAPVPAVVVAHAARMKEPWCLATSLAERKAQDVVALYGKRFSIEETFRDEKDIHFGLGLSATHVGSCDRRDRLLLLAAIAHALLTLLGAAGEKVGLDREFQTSPKRGRALSLFGQGVFWYGALPNMKDEKALPLMTAFDEVVREHAIFRQIFGIL